MNAEHQAITRGPRAYLSFIGIGLAAGLLSGLFGVGGGTVIVPLLVLLLSFGQRISAGTSLAAIVPTASVGVISYATSGSVAWIPALILAAGAVVGAQIGSRLLPRVSQTALRWGFVAFLLVGLFMGIARQNLLACGVAIAAAFGLLITPTVLDNILSATVSAETVMIDAGNTVVAAK